MRLGGVGHVTAADLGAIKPYLQTVTQSQQLMTAFEALAEDLPSGACPVVDGGGKLLWYISADTLKICGATSEQLANALSKPIEVLYETMAGMQPGSAVSESAKDFRLPVTIAPTATAAAKPTHDHVSAVHPLPEAATAATAPPDLAALVSASMKND